MQSALNTYSLRKEWKKLTQNGLGPVVKLCKECGITEIELYDGHYNNDGKKLTEVQKELEGHGLHIFSLGPHPRLLTNPRMFKKAIADGKRCVDMAADHNIHLFRVSIGGGKYKPKFKFPKSMKQAVEWAVQVFKPVVEYAETRGVTLAIETHHRYSSNAEWQRRLLEAIPSDNLGFIFDIGNHETDRGRWKSLKVLIEKKAVKYVHAKCYDFDAEGNETTLDYPRMAKELHEAGLEVNLSIEWEGKLGGFLGTLKTNELNKYSIAKSLGQEYTMKTDFPPEEALYKRMTA